MASGYARQRAENIARNAEKLAELGIQNSAKLLKIPISSEKRKKKHKGYAPEKPKKRRRNEPVVLRRSLRAQGISPEPESSKQELSDEPEPDPESEELDELDWENPVPFSEVRIKDDENSLLARIAEAADGQIREDQRRQNENDGELDPLSLKLDPKDTVRLVPKMILSLMILPLRTKVAVAAGDRKGHIGLWDADHYDENDESVVHVYRPHRETVSAMASPPASSTQIATCSFDGSVLIMDIVKAAFSRVYYSATSITAMTYLTDSSGNIISVGDYGGDIKLVDVRSSKVAAEWTLHDRRVHSIDACPQRPHQIATCSADATVSLWDVRVSGNRNLATMAHRRTVHSVYFSPSGGHLASTSSDDHVGLWSGRHGDEPVMIRHDNQTNRWIATFRAIWSWSDSYVFITNMNRGIDVISTRERKLIGSLRDEEMGSIPSRLARHPLLPGVVAGGTAGGKVFLWRA